MALVRLQSIESSMDGTALGRRCHTHTRDGSQRSTTILLSQIDDNDDDDDHEDDDDGFFSRLEVSERQRLREIDFVYAVV